MGVFIVKFNLKSDIVWPPKCPQKLYSLVREGGRTPVCASWYVRWFLNLEAKSADVVSNDGHKVVTNLLRPSAQWVIYFFEIAFSFVTNTHSSQRNCDGKFDFLKNWIPFCLKATSSKVTPSPPWWLRNTHWSRKYKLTQNKFAFPDINYWTFNVIKEDNNSLWLWEKVRKIHHLKIGQFFEMVNTKLCFLKILLGKVKVF